MKMIRKVYQLIYNRIIPIQIAGMRNKFDNQSSIKNNFFVKIIGNNNSIKIGKNCLLSNTNINILGNNNQIVIENNVRFMGPCKIIMGSNSTLHIKWNAGIRGVEFNLDNANIEVGELCMFSYGITLRNHDSHKVLDKIWNIVNLPQDIILGKHVWIGQDAKILKGCRIGEDSIIGFGAIVTKSCETGSILAGVPAKVVKKNITWNY